MANIREVARRAGVSSGTVSRYLNGVKIRDDNARAIARAITELDYRPSFFGRALTMRRGFSVGVLVDNMANVFAGALIGGLEAGFERRGYSTFFFDFRSDLDLLKEKIAFLKERMADGIVVFLFETDRERLRFLDDVEVPIVFVDNPLDDPEADSIVVSNTESTEEVVGAMLDAGHRRIGCIALPSHVYVGAARALGWQNAYARRALPMHQEDVCYAGQSKRAGYEAACHLLDAGNVTALFASNYYTALGALKAINERGMRPGIDIGFASFDDFDFSDVVYPPLTVIRQPVGTIATTVVDRLCSRLDGGAPAQGIQVLPCTVSLTDSIYGGLSRG